MESIRMFSGKMQDSKPYILKNTTGYCLLLIDSQREFSREGQ